MTNKAITFGLTAFLDILGFGARVKSPVVEIDLIVADVKRIQREFEFKPKDPKTRSIQTAYKKTVLAFSDSVIVNVPLQSKMTEVQGTFDAFMSELDLLAMAQARCATQGLFLRGGVDLGWWYRRGDTLVSQSMARAYEAEGLANVPVIALTADAYDFMSKHRERGFYSDDIEPIGRYLRPYPNLEKVEFWYLDYIGMFADDIDWITNREQLKKFRSSSSEDEKDEIVSAGRRENTDRWFAQHARKIEAAFLATTVPKVRRKYRWLSSYHNEVAKKYGVSKSSLCTVR